MKSKVLQTNPNHVELFHLMKQRVQALLNGKREQSPVITFTSYRKGEGVSSLLANLALTLSEDPECRILLVDFNLQYPSLYRFFPCNGNVVDVSKGHDSMSHEMIARDREMIRVSPNLDVIINKHKSERYLDQNRMIYVERFLQRAKERYNYILIDGPPLYYNSFANLLAAKSDYTVLVVQAHGVRHQVLRDAILQLERLGANILGVILNKREYPIPDFIYRKL